MRKPSLTNKIRRGVKTLKRLSDEGKMEFHFVIDKSVTDGLARDEIEEVKAFEDFICRYITWMASDESEDNSTQDETKTASAVTQ